MFECLLRYLREDWSSADHINSRLRKTTEKGAGDQRRLAATQSSPIMTRIWSDHEDGIIIIIMFE